MNTYPQVQGNVKNMHTIVVYWRIIIYICTYIRRVDIIINVNLFLCYDEQTVGFC